MSASARRLDDAVARFVRAHGHTPDRDRAVARFSRLGEHGAVWIALGAAGAVVAPPGPRRRRWIAASGSVAAAYVANTAVKLIVRRRRPALGGQLTSTPTQLSFPSAHASTSFAGARALSRAGGPAAPLWGLALGLSLSRLYLGVHYPSDLIGGALLGMLVGGAVKRRSGP